MGKAQRRPEVLVIRIKRESGKLDNLVNRYDYSNLFILAHIYK